MPGGSPVLELRVREPADLRAWWLDGYAAGGLFVPGTIELSAGSTVVVRVVIERSGGDGRATAGSTNVLGTVVFRRHAAGSAAPPGAAHLPLRPGVGVAFEPSVRARVVHLERLSRGAINEARASARYAVELPAHVALRDGEQPSRAVLDEIGARGARVTVPSGAIAVVSSRVVIAIHDPDVGVSRALGGRVAWTDRAASNVFGVALELETREDRAAWARVVTRAREAMERRRVSLDRLVAT